MQESREEAFDDALGGTPETPLVLLMATWWPMASSTL
jgi:hypothetical protein